MHELGIALVALAAGIAAGAAVVAVRPKRIRDDDASTARLEARLEVQAEELRRLSDSAATRASSAEQLRAGLDGARRALDQLTQREDQRVVVEAESRDVIRRLSTVLAGGASKGRAGENVLREHLADLPPGMLVTDFRVGGKVVEFGLLLPDGRRLPIDSKWTALGELEALEGAADAVEHDACARAVERVVASRAKEVAQYLDPALTAPVA